MNYAYCPTMSFFLIMSIFVYLQVVISLSAHISAEQISSTAEHNICRKNSWKEGVWKLRTDLNYSQTVYSDKSFYCCGSDRNDYLKPGVRTDLCGVKAQVVDRGRNGYVGPGPLPTESFRHSSQHACDCDEAQGRETVNTRERYDWKPKSCSLLPWNSTLFCELLGSRKILLIGDSTMAQVAATLWNMIIKNNKDACAKQVHLARSDLLFVSLKKGDQLFHNFIEIVIPDIVIFNAGAHLHDMGDISDTWEHLKPYIESFRTKYPRMHFVWKSQNPGHVGCKAFTEPITEFKPEMHADVSSINSENVPGYYGLDYYQWNLHPFFRPM